MAEGAPLIDKVRKDLEKSGHLSKLRSKIRISLLKVSLFVHMALNILKNLKSIQGKKKNKKKENKSKDK